MRFEFATSSRIVFGRGAAGDIGRVASELGRRALVVTGRRQDRAKASIDRMVAAGIRVATAQIEHEPTTGDVIGMAALARRERFDLVVGIGGGSVIDGAKAIAALLTNPGELFDYLEIVGNGKALACAAAPCVAVPTTAGTGAEATRNSVLAVPSHRVKVSLRSPHLLPRVAIVDPALTDGLPAGLTATTGLDALTQLIEPYVSCRSNPLTDAICVEGMRRAGRSLRTAVADGTNVEARDDMMLASLFGGMALANAGLGAVHGFAGPVGGAFPAPHGAICAAILPHVTAINVGALRGRQPDHPSLRRYGEVARILTGTDGARPEDLAMWMADLVRDLRIPPLSAYGIASSDVESLIEAASRASSMKGNPIVLTPEEGRAVLQLAMNASSVSRVTV